MEKITSFDLRSKILGKFAQKEIISSQEEKKIRQAHDDHQETLACIVSWLISKQVTFELFSLRLKLELDTFDCVLTVGGDGTLLAVSHQMKNPTVLIGVRSSGTSVGYLCCCDQSTFAATMEKFLNKTLTFVAASRISARITHAHDQTQIRSCPALNDILYTNENPAGTTRYNLNINGKKETHHSSGIWIATSAGSSAGIMAAGGEQVELSDPRFQYCVRELYAFQNKQLALRKGFIDLPPAQSSTSEVFFHIENRCDRAVIALDGQEEILYMEWGDKVEFFQDEPLHLAIA